MPLSPSQTDDTVLLRRMPWSLKFQLLNGAGRCDTMSRPFCWQPIHPKPRRSLIMVVTFAVLTSKFWVLMVTGSKRRG